MKILVWSMKGGCGKSTISVAIQQSIKDAQIITNDPMNGYQLVMKDKNDFYMLPKDAEIPSFNDDDVKVIYDMAGASDNRLKKFISSSKDLKIVIPFNSDVLSFQAAISVYNEIKNLNNNVIFVLNRSKKGDYQIFEDELASLKIKNKLFELKESTMFSNIFNKRQSIEEAKNNVLLKHSYKAAIKQLDDLLMELK